MIAHLKLKLIELENQSEARILHRQPKRSGEDKAETKSPGDLAKGGYKKMKRKYELNQDCFNNLNNETAYWLGFLYGDSNCSQENKMRLQIQWSDRDHLFALRNFMGTIDRPVKQIITDTSNNASIEVRSWKIHNVLKKYSITTIKKNRGRLHFSLLQPEIRRHFLRGLFDADGSFYYNTKTNDLFAEITGYKPILQDVKNILVEDKIINETKNIVKNGSVFRIRLAKNDTIKLIDYLYRTESNGNKPRYFLKRKYALVKQYRERLNISDNSNVVSDSPQKVS